MKRYRSVASLVMVVVVVLGLAGPVAAGEQVPLEGSLEGTFTRTPVLGTPFVDIELTGWGQATQLGQFTLDMPHRVDFSKPPPKGAGAFTLTAANGDTVFGTVSGEATPTDVPGVIYGVETMIILGGTGRFAGASGQFVMERLIDTVNLTTIGAFEGTVSHPGP
jgi:hypothetical protein